MKCFVIMPFGNPSVDFQHQKRLDHIYTEWIKPTVECISVPHQQGGTITCHRGDKDNRPGEIINHILEYLTSADIVIADLSGKNPNVFYELGVRHAVNKNTLLIADNIHDIPFDLRGQRTLPYQYDHVELVKFRRQLKEAIINLISSDVQIDNPVRQFLYNQATNRILTSPTTPGYDVVKTVLSEMATMKLTFEMQMRDIKNLIQEMTLPHSNIGVGENENDLSFLEGAWESSINDSMVYAKMEKGKISAPFCRYGDLNQIAHFYDFRRIGNTIISRFKWLATEDQVFNFEGLTVLKIESSDRLVGGWWRGAPQASENAESINMNHPGMMPCRWIRRKTIKSFPLWAEEYFKNMEKNGIPGLLPQGI